MAIELYWGSGSPFAWRVLLALEIKRIPYDSKCLMFSEQEHKSPAFLAINPRGKVPALRDGDYTLHESIAILSYLDKKYPDPALFGTTAAEHGLIWLSIMECTNYLDPYMMNFARAIFAGQLAEKHDEIVESRKALESELTRIDQILSGADYLVGNQLSAADIVLYPDIQLLARAANKEGVEAISGTLRSIEGNYPSLNAWCKRIETLPGFENTYPPHWR